MKALLEGRKLLLKAGTIVDATIIGAPSSTKHATKTRDPEMRQTKKGNPWYFGMKVPVQETTLHGDKADYKAEDTLPWELSGGRYLVNKSRKRTDYWDAIHRTRPRIRAMVEHPFHTITRLWGFTTVRYRGLAKNTARVYALCTLANLFRLRHRLRPQGTSCRKLALLQLFVAYFRAYGPRRDAHPPGRQNP